MADSIADIRPEPPDGTRLLLLPTGYGELSATMRADEHAPEHEPERRWVMETMQTWRQVCEGVGAVYEVSREPLAALPGYDETKKED